MSYMPVIPPNGFGQFPLIWAVDRVGVDGTDKILPLLGSDNFVGDVLSNEWQKEYLTMIGTPTMLLDGGALKMKGTGHADGYAQDLRSRHLLYLVDGLTVDVHMKLDALASTATHNITAYFIGGNSWFWVTLYANTSVYWIDVGVYRNGAVSTILSGNIVADQEGTFRLVFDPNGTGYTHVYFHEGSGDVDESSDEVYGSPFDLDIGVDLCALWFRQHNFEAVSHTVESNFVHVTYPEGSTLLRHQLAAQADRYKNRCRIFDTNGSVTESEWTEIFDCDHKLVGDTVMQNGLMRLFVDEKAQYGLMVYYWNGAAWDNPLNRLYLLLTGDSKILSYPALKNVDMSCPDKAIFTLRLHDSALENDDYYADVRVTLQRGSYSIQIEVLAVYPLQDVRFAFLNSTALRFGYVGDVDSHGIGDDELDLTANNTTLSDNFMIAFDDAGDELYAFVCSNIQPDSRFQASDGGDLIIEDFTVANLRTAKVFVGIVPFSNVVHLFDEAEDGTLST